VLEPSGLSPGTPANLPPRPPRKNVMLAATISAGTESAPVRIRNLSELGAMIDGPALPPTGSRLMLERMTMSVAATVIWNDHGRCGLSLGHPIVVDDWIAGAASTAANSGQFRVDQIQSAVRNGAALPAESQASAPGPDDLPPVERRVAGELTRVKRMLDQVGAALTDDVDVLRRHQRALQSFDIAAMIVEELATVLVADDRDRAVGLVHMHELRSRLSGRPTLT
jgi:hypothetical protein